jgi:hypothetical protein
MAQITIGVSGTTVTSALASVGLVITPSTGNITVAAEAGRTLTLAATDTNKNIILTPHGTGDVIVSAGNLLLGGLATDGTGALQLKTGTTSAAGLTFGDTASTINVYQSGANTLAIGGTSAITTFLGTTASATTGTGALVVTGGVGIGGNLNVGGTFGLTGAATFTSTVTASDFIIGASGPSVKSSLNARPARQGLVFDGTGNATISLASSAFGQSDFSIAVWVNPADSTGIRSIVGGTTAASLYLNSGEITYYKNGGTPIGTAVYLTAGKTASVVWKRASGVNTISVDGIVKYTSAAESPYVDYASAITAIGVINGYYFAGSVLQPLIYNRALSAAEVLALTESGRPSVADLNSASNTAINTQNFANGATAYDTLDGLSATGFHAINDGTAQAFAVSAPTFAVKVGAKYRVTFTATLTSGSAPIVFIGTSSSGAAKSNAPSVTAGSNSVEFTIASAEAAAALVFYNGAEATEYTIASVSVTLLGLLLCPDEGSGGAGATWAATPGTTATITLPASGVSWALPRNTITLGPTAALAATLAGTATGGLTIKPVDGTSVAITAGLTTAGAILNLHTNEPSVVVNDILGRISFAAPLESDGTDAILTAASIVASAEGTFGAASNATSLLFQTGASETATTKMTLTSAGLLTVTGGITSTGVLTSSSGRVLVTSTKTSAYPITSADHVLLGNHATTPFTMTLPAVAAVATGQTYVIKNINAAAVTVQGDGAELIDNANTLVLAQWESATLINTGTIWVIV